MSEITAGDKRNLAQKAIDTQNWDDVDMTATEVQEDGMVSIEEIYVTDK